MYKYDYELELKRKKELEEKIEKNEITEEELKEYDKMKKIEEKAKLMNPDCSMLYEGMIIKDYKEFCNLMNEKELNGHSKTAQLKRWENFFSFEKEEGKKSYVIKEIYDQPKEDDSKYFACFKHVLLTLLNQYSIEYKNQINSDGILEMSIYRKKFFEDMGFWNDEFAKGKNEVWTVTQILNASDAKQKIPYGNQKNKQNEKTDEKTKDNEKTEDKSASEKDKQYYIDIINKWNELGKEDWNNFIANEGIDKETGKIRQPDLFYIEKSFFNDVETKCFQIADSSMKKFTELFNNAIGQFENQKIITLYNPMAIQLVTIDADACAQGKNKTISRFATEEEQDKIVKIEFETLKQLGCDTEYQAHMKGLYPQYHQIVKEKIIEAGIAWGYVYHFRAIRLRFLVPAVQHFLAKLIGSCVKSNLFDCLMETYDAEDKQKFKQFISTDVVTPYYCSNYYKKSVNDMNIAFSKTVIESCVKRATDLINNEIDLFNNNLRVGGKDKDESYRLYGIRKANANLNYINNTNNTNNTNNDNTNNDNNDDCCFNSYSKLSPQENAIMYLRRAIELTMNYVLRSNNVETKEIFKDYIECDENKVLELLNSVGNKKNKKKE